MLTFLLTARLILGLAYSVAIPLGEAPDEADHHAYAAYIAQEHRLPEGAWMTQAKHPPMYHALAALVAGPVGMDAGFLRANPDVGFTPDASPNFFIHTMVESWPWRDGPLAMHLARLISVLAGVGLVSATYVLGRAIWPGRPAVALAAAAFVAFLPESLFIGGAVSNDMLAAFLATMALWAGMRSRRFWQAILTGILMGLGLWAKVSVAALWPVVCLAMVARGWDDGRPTTDEKRETRNEKRSASPWWPWALAIVAGGVALLVTAPWFLRNRQLYDDWMGWPLVLATIDRRTGPFGLVESAWLMRGLFLGFWGKFGGAGHIALPWPFYALWAALVGASALGWLRRAWEWAKGGKGERANPQSAIRNRLARRAADDHRLVAHLQPCGARHRPGTAAVSGHRTAGFAAGRRSGTVAASDVARARVSLVGRLDGLHGRDRRVGSRDRPCAAVCAASRTLGGRRSRCIASRTDIRRRTGIGRLSVGTRSR